VTAVSMPGDASRTGGADALAALRSRTGAGLIVATVLASMVTFLDANVVNVAIPAIGKDLGAGVAGLQWVLTGYLLTAAALLLPFGSLADRFGRRRLLVLGLLILAAGSTLCAVAPSVVTLTGARVVQGVGAAMVVPNSLALLNGTLRMSDRARAIGIWAALATLGTTVGPYAGGWLVDHATWRAIFLLNIPLILLALLALRTVPESLDPTRAASFDAIGAALAVLGLGSLVYALTAGSKAGWLSPQVLVAGVVGVVALAALPLVERRKRAPMLRLSLFRSRQFDAINVTTVLLYGGLSGASYLLVLQCELQLGYSASQAGAVLIPSSVFFFALSPVSGALVSRTGPRWLMVAGILCVAGGFAWLSTAHAGSSYVRAILPGVLLWGVGIGLTVTPLTAAVLAAVGDADLGEASAINDASSRLGGVLTVAAVPLLLGVSSAGGLGRALVDGYQPALLTLAGLAAAAAVVTGLFVSDARAAAPRLAAPAPHHGCALPIVHRSRSSAFGQAQAKP
jgi:EmrB/QacA subfamily drug resistance transporter